jgi:TonB-linked SusC/RagA family outer membrane protein
MNLKLFSMGFRDKIFLLSMFFIFIVSAQAQKKVSGTVLSEGSPLPGVNIVIKDTNVSVSTGFDGGFSINAPANATTLVVSYLGFTTKEVAITGQEMQISLVDEVKTLNEIVVNVGYGTQKKSVVTGSISSIKASDIEKLPVIRIEQTLQGRAAGVNVITNSGQPGSGGNVTIRGATSINNSGALWVVDGIVVDGGGIGYLNQSDIQSIEVLKDAASAAIYGTRSAAGVILITTKKGSPKSMVVNYTGYSGVSSPSKTLKLLNATQYAVLRNEASTNGGGGLIFPNPSSLGRGSDWQKEVFNNNAIKTSHQVSISGGTDKSTFYMSLGYFDQEGIVATDISKYNRKNFRINSNHKVKDWLTIDQSLGFSADKANGIGTNTEYGGPLSSAINLDPTTPVVVTDPVVAGAPPYNNTYIIRDEYGNPYGISTQVGQEMTNPVAYQKTKLGNYDWGNNLVGNISAEIAPIKSLKFKTTFAGKWGYWGGQSFTPKYYLSPTVSTSSNNIYRHEHRGLNWNIENTLTYTKKIGNHNFSLLLGQSAYVDNNVHNSNITKTNIGTNSYLDASINYTVPTADVTAAASDNVQHKISSLFSRLIYDYNEKYLLTGIIRRDGSTRFGANKKYGIFPSVSAGWVVSKEGFWRVNSVINQLKFRGGYGINGNDSYGENTDFRYLTLIDSGFNYPVGTGPDSTIGYAPNTLSNPDLQWEETTQSNIGFDAKLFNSLTIDFDLYNKTTKGMLMENEVPGFLGVSANPSANIGDMENKGFEVSLTYKKKIGQVNYSLNGNYSFNENKITYLGNNKQFLNGGQSVQSSTYPITRVEVGLPFGAFYGFETAGVFQNMDEVNAYTNASGGLIQPLAVPGDFRWKDVNGDGKITGDDRTYLGTPIPKHIFGITLNADYKGFDIMVMGQGAAGNKIYQGLRRLDIGSANYQTSALTRWNGEGTSNDYPRLTTNDTNLNFSNPSDFYLEKGDYVRLKIAQIGYSLPSSLINKIKLQKVRLFVTGENLLTFTKYSGYDPEIGGGSTGIDRGYYPQARTFMFGANLQF